MSNSNLIFQKCASSFLILCLLSLSSIASAKDDLEDIAKALEFEAKPSQKLSEQNKIIQSQIQNAVQKIPDGVTRHSEIKPEKTPDSKSTLVKAADTHKPQLPTEARMRLPIVPSPQVSQIPIEMNEAVAPKLDRLKSCLTNLKTDIRYQSSDESKALIYEYVDKQNHLFDKIEANKSSDIQVERRRLLYLNWIAMQKLSECIDLSDGPSKSRYIYLVGQQAKNDGKSFETIAATLVSEMLQKICPTSEISCVRQIAFKQQIQKNDLILYLKLLTPGSVKYLAYVGHGWSYGFLLGFKDMSVPADWHPYSKLTNLGWQAERQGAIYGDDMKYLGPIIAKALDPYGAVAIFACDTADFLAPNLSGQLPKTAKVRAAYSGMEYKEVPGTNSWFLSLPTGERFLGPKLMMYPDAKNAFKLVPPREFKYSQDFKDMETNPSQESLDGIGLDDMTSAVLTRVGRKEAWFDWVGSATDSERLIVFDIRDRATIASVFKVPPTGHGLIEDDLEITFSDYDEKVKQVLKSKSGAEKAYYQDLFDRVTACINDGVNKYY